MRRQRAYFAAVFLIWLGGMAWLIRSEYFSHSEVTTGYRHVLERIEEPKVTCLGIYYGLFEQKRVGEVYTTILPRMEDDRSRLFEIETDVSLAFPVEDPLAFDQLGRLFDLPPMKTKEFQARFISVSTIDSDYELQDVKFTLQSQAAGFSWEGKVSNGCLFLTFLRDGKKSTREIPLPSGTMVGSLGMAEQFPDLELGKKFSMRWFDPFTREHKVVRCEVTEEVAEYRWARQEPTVHAYKIKSDLDGLNSTAWVAQNGEVLECRVLALRLTKEAPSPRPESDAVPDGADKDRTEKAGER